MQHTDNIYDDIYNEYERINNKKRNERYAEEERFIDLYVSISLICREYSEIIKDKLKIQAKKSDQIIIANNDSHELYAYVNLSFCALRDYQVSTETENCGAGHEKSFAASIYAFAENMNKKNEAFVFWLPNEKLLKESQIEQIDNLYRDKINFHIIYLMCFIAFGSSSRRNKLNDNMYNMLNRSMYDHAISTKIINVDFDFQYFYALASTGAMLFKHGKISTKKHNNKRYMTEVKPISQIKKEKRKNL